MIGVYDIDLWHGVKSMPNLELMQIYNYYYKKGDRVIMLKPKDSITPFNRVFYFKENKKSKIPNSLDLSDEKIKVIGSGFYGKLPQLKPEILNTPPAYDPYDIYSYKLKVSKGYDTLKRSSLIRIETNNFAGFDKDNTNIYVADSNFLYSAGAEDFLQQNKNHNYLFFRPLLAKDMDTALRFLRYGILFNREIIIGFKFDQDFFIENMNEKFVFACGLRENESEENFLLRMTKMALVYKNKKKLFRFFDAIPNTPAAQYVVQWATTSSTQLSYAQFFSSNGKALSELNGMDSELRLLLKTDPLKINIKSIDLNKNL